jgi:hypothetical protein
MHSGLRSRIAILVLEAGQETLAEVMFEDAAHARQILLHIVDEQRAVDHRIFQRLGNLRLAAAGNGARFVAESAFRIDADQAPGRRAGMRRISTL